MKKNLTITLFIIFCCACSTTRFTDPVTVPPDTIRTKPDIRIEEIYLVNGDTLIIDQERLIATWIDKDSLWLYDHEGEYLDLRISDIAGIKVRYKDFERSATRTYIGRFVAIAGGFIISASILICILFFSLGTI